MSTWVLRGFEIVRAFPPVSKLTRNSSRDHGYHLRQAKNGNYWTRWRRYYSCLSFIIIAWRSRLQKFGLDSLKSDKMRALELEIAKEKSTALGVAGKRLRDSIAEYTQSISSAAVSSDERARLLSSVSANVQALIVQRELVGFTHDNMKWINQTYEVPEEALAKLGEVQPPNLMSP
jgi:hypothetical protein